MGSIDASLMIPTGAVSTSPFLEEEDRNLLAAAVPEVERFVREIRLFDRVDRSWYADGLIDKVMVFLFQGEIDGWSDEQSWVVVGDLPPWVGPPHDGDRPVDALKRYVEELREVIACVRAGAPLEDIDLPICGAYSSQLATIDDELLLGLEGRLVFIEEQIVPWLGEGQ
jgi:hypothetical protein